jgi:hypothetical protein
MYNNRTNETINNFVYTNCSLNVIIEYEFSERKSHQIDDCKKEFEVKVSYVQ